MLDGVKISLHRKSLAEQVFQHIKRMILSEELQAGERIPEERVAQAFGVSRTPIREAIRQLETYGLVTIVPRSHAEVVKLDEEDARQIGQVRMQLERLSIRLLTEKATEEDIRALYVINDECQLYVDKGDIGGTFERDSELHLEIARRSGNAYLSCFLQNLDVKIQLIRITSGFSIDMIRQNVLFHKQILDALSNRQVEQAEHLMEEHISSSVIHLPTGLSS